jgi:hypothetical protein
MTGLVEERFSPGSGQRCLAWIDRVGGFLLCLGDAIRVGQAAAAATVEIPIAADLSRHHASFLRQGEVYLLEPRGETWLRGERLTETRTLRDGDVIRLGASCQLRFRVPHPWSRTARLDLLSGHATRPATDGVLLVAQACVLGPQASSHIVCPNWTRSLTLVRQNGFLGWVADGTLEVEGQAAEGRGVLRPGSRIQADDLGLALEPLD